MKMMTLFIIFCLSTTALAQRRFEHQSTLDEIAQDIDQAERKLGEAKRKLLNLRNTLGRRSDPIIAISKAKPVLTNMHCSDLRGDPTRHGPVAIQKQSIQQAINNVLAACRTSGRPTGDCDERNIMLEFNPDPQDAQLTCITTARLN